jgi:hypothetical protein
MRNLSAVDVDDGAGQQAPRSADNAAAAARWAAVRLCWSAFSDQHKRRRDKHGERQPSG